jgi:hypothetical protein
MSTVEHMQVHGFTDKAMHIYMAQPQDPLRIVRGGIFGGTLPYVSHLCQKLSLFAETELVADRVRVKGLYNSDASDADRRLPRH